MLTANAAINLGHRDPHHITSIEEANRLNIVTFDNPVKAYMSKDICINYLSEEGECESRRSLGKYCTGYFCKYATEPDDRSKEVIQSESLAKALNYLKGKSHIPKLSIMREEGNMDIYYIIRNNITYLKEQGYITYDEHKSNMHIETCQRFLSKIKASDVPAPGVFTANGLENKHRAFIMRNKKLFRFYL